MSQSNIDKPSMQDPAGTLHAGVDLDNRRGVYKMIGKRLKSEIAQRELSDLGRRSLAP
jgi:hypothetical protein